MCYEFHNLTRLSLLVIAMLFFVCVQHVSAATNSWGVNLTVVGTSTGTSTATSTATSTPTSTPPTSSSSVTNAAPPTSGSISRILLTPPNDFRATIDGTGITFNWSNPTNFSYVRLVRSEYGYPLDPLNGRVVYEGSGNYAADDHLEYLQGGYYYSIFTFNKDGFYSSPAILYITYDLTKYHTETSGITQNKSYDYLIDDTKPYYDQVYPPSNTAGYLCGSIDSFMVASSSSATSTHEKVNFSQNGKVIHSLSSLVSVDADTPITLTVPSGGNIQDGDLLSMCLSAGQEESQKAYIFSYNKDTSIYTLILPPFIQLTDYHFYVGLVKKGSNHEDIVYKGGFTFSSSQKNAPIGISKYLLISFWFILVFILIFLVFLSRKLL